MIKCSEVNDNQVPHHHTLIFGNLMENICRVIHNPENAFQWGKSLVDDVDL